MAAGPRPCYPAIQRDFGLCQHLLRMMLTAFASLGTEPKEARSQELIENIISSTPIIETILTVQHVYEWIKVSQFLHWIVYGIIPHRSPPA